MFLARELNLRGENFACNPARDDRLSKCRAHDKRAAPVARLAPEPAAVNGSNPPIKKRLDMTQLLLRLPRKAADRWMSACNATHQVHEQQDAPSL
jgi:hypothetical protein